MRSRYSRASSRSCHRVPRSPFGGTIRASTTWAFSKTANCFTQGSAFSAFSEPSSASRIFFSMASSLGNLGRPAPDAHHHVPGVPSRIMDRHEAPDRQALEAAADVLEQVGVVADGHL